MAVTCVLPPNKLHRFAINVLHTLDGFIVAPTGEVGYGVYGRPCEYFDI